MILLYFVLLIISIALYFLIGNFTHYTAIKVAISLLFLIFTSVYITQLIKKGHQPPQGSKVIDMEDMRKKWDQYTELKNNKK